MGIRAAFARWLTRTGGETPAELLPRARRRKAARERHREGGPLWTDGDRHVEPRPLNISELADTGGIGKPIVKLPRLDGND